MALGRAFRRGAGWEQRAKSCLSLTGALLPIRDWQAAAHRGRRWRGGPAGLGPALLVGLQQTHPACPGPASYLQLDPSNVHAFFNRGISHEKLGALTAAVDDFSACIRLDPGNAVAYYNRAAALDALGQYERAVADYRAALDAEK